MAQVSPQHCPRCGTEIVPQQKFCATCGLPRALQDAAQPPSPQPLSTVQAPLGGYSASSQPPAGGQMSMHDFSPPQQQAPSPPMSQAPMGGYPPPLQQSAVGQAGGYPSTFQQPPSVDQAPLRGYPSAPQQFPSGQPSLGGYLSTLQQPPDQRASEFSSPAPSGKRKIGRVGFISLLVALLLLLVALGYVALQVLGVGRPAQAPITTTDMNTAVTYASTNLTVINVQQSHNFLDDPHTVSDGMLRLHIQARNTSKQSVALPYKNIAHLVLPNGKEIVPVYVSGNPTVAAGATQTNDVDFALPTNEKVNQLRVRLGAANEAQLDVPLTGHADVSMYATKTVKLTKELLYFNMSWTLVNASSQLSFNGQQASKGMRYVTITFNISNPLMETVIPGSPYVYMHLKAGNNETNPVSADVPVSFEAGESNKVGVATFQVPQEGSNLTLTLGAESSTGFDATTAIFQF